MLMEVTGPEQGLQRLENLADNLDANPKDYDQTSFSSCALGRYAKEEGRFGELAGSMLSMNYGPYSWAAREFNISAHEAFSMFNAHANNDPLSAAEAAARIRKFVYEKRQMLIAA